MNGSKYTGSIKEWEQIKGSKRFYICCSNIGVTFKVRLLLEKVGGVIGQPLGVQQEYVLKDRLHKSLGDIARCGDAPDRSRNGEKGS